MEMFEMKDMQEALDVTVEESWTMYNIITFRPNTGVLLNGACARNPTRTLTAEQQDWVRLWVRAPLHVCTQFNYNILGVWSRPKI
jgi:hypothetical protein